LFIAVFIRSAAAAAAADAAVCAHWLFCRHSLSAQQTGAPYSRYIAVAADNRIAPDGHVNLELVVIGRRRHIYTHGDTALNAAIYYGILFVTVCLSLSLSLSLCVCVCVCHTGDARQNS